MSSNTRSNRSRSSAARASSPSTANAIWYSWSCRNPPRTSRSIRTVAGSSSTIRMRLVERVSPGASSMAISETSHEVSSLTLGIVQGVVGALDQVGDVSGVVGVTGDAEARRQRSVLKRIALDDRAHALGVDDRGRLGGARQERDELVAAVSSHDRVAPRLARQELHDLLEHVVAGAVAPAIVDGLEAVEVEQDERQRLLVAGGAAHLFVEPQHQIAPVIAVRQRILERELLEPCTAYRDRRVGRERSRDVFEAGMERNRLAVDAHRVDQLQHAQVSLQGVPQRP